MEFIYSFFIIFITSTVLSIILKKRIEQVIPIAIVFIILTIYITGLFDNLQMGVMIICFSIFVQLVFLFIYFNKSIENIKNILNNILTPGLVIYMLLFIISIIFNKGRVFEDYDEYNHWGIMIKNMFLYNSYGTNPESIVAFNDYPPFTSIFQYLFIQIKGIYSEDVIITAHNILYFSIIIPITKNIMWKKNLKNMILAIPMIVFIPIIFYPNFYTNILVDGILGVAFAYIIYSFYKTESDIKFQFLEIFCGLTILILTKTQGIGIAILAIVVLAISLIMNKKETKEKRKTKAILFIVAIICSSILLMIWNIKVQQVQHRWDLKQIYEIDLLKLITGQEEDICEITKRFINAIFINDTITERRLTTFSAMLGIFILMLFQYHNIETKQKKKYRFYMISMIISSLIYLIAMLFMYCTIFDKVEALQLASFPRYIFTILLANVVFISFVFLENESKSNTIIIGVISLIIIMLPFRTIQAKYINYKEYIKISNYNRYINTQIKKYKSDFSKEDKVILITDKNVSDSIVQLALNQYVMMPINIKATVPKMVGTLENFINILIKDGYTHVFVYKATDDAKKEYSKIFEDENMKDDTLYKVYMDKNNILKLMEISK